MFVWKAFTLWRTYQGVRPSPIVSIMHKILLAAVVVYDRLVNRSFQNNRAIVYPVRSAAPGRWFRSAVQDY